MVCSGSLAEVMSRRNERGKDERNEQHERGGKNYQTEGKELAPDKRPQAAQPRRSIPDLIERVLQRTDKAGSSEEQDGKADKPRPAFRLRRAGRIQHVLDSTGAGRTNY